MALNYTTDELAALKREHAPNATEEQFDLWMVECRNRKAIPVHDVFLQIRNVKEWDPDQKKKVFKKKAIYGTTIAFLRKVAQRSREYAGQLPSEWIYLDGMGDPTVKSTVPLKDKHPYAAQVSILRHGWAHPTTVIARWDAYAQSYKDDAGNSVLSPTWSMRGAEQLEKCAEALALRKAFPEELGPLYLPEEIKEDMDFPSTQQLPIPKRTNGKTKRDSADGDSGKAATEEESQTTTPDRPSPEEMKEFGRRLRKHGEVVSMEGLKSFAFRTAGVKNSDKLTKAHWEDILVQLDKAAMDPGGIEALISKEQ